MTIEELKKIFEKAEADSHKIITELDKRYGYHSMHFADARAVRMCYIEVERALEKL